MTANDPLEALLLLHPDDLLGYFYYNRDALKDYRVVLFSYQGEEFPNKFKSIISNNISMLSLSPESNFFVMDSDTATETVINNGKSDIGIAGCVHFDTQIVSYLNRVYDCGDKDNTLYDTYSFLKKVLEERLDFTDDLYIIENSTKIKDEKTFDKMKECLLSYAHYKETTPQQFELDFGKKDIFNANDYSFVEKAIQNIDVFEKFYFQEIFDFIYCLLLKLACIDFSSNKSSKNKFLLLNTFVINELGTYFERELAVCYFYLYKNDNIQNFFKRFKRNANDLLGVIHGMAWDLTHIRIIERFMALDQIDKKHFTNHYMVTYDRGLRDVLTAFPLDRIVFHNGEYKESFKKSLYLLGEDIGLAQLYTESSTKREEVRKSRDFAKIKESLINELNEILKAKKS